jgi:hypothetical protein
MNAWKIYSTFSLGLIIIRGIWLTVFFFGVSTSDFFGSDLFPYTNIYAWGPAGFTFMRGNDFSLYGNKSHPLGLNGKAYFFVSNEYL